MAVIPIYILAGQSNAQLYGVDAAIENTLNDAGAQYELVKTAVNGTQLYTSPGLDDWNVNSNELYSELLNNIQAAIANIEAQGHTASIEGMLWIQGEADAKHLFKAQDYQTNLTNFINQLRSDLGQGDFEVILSELSEHSALGQESGGNAVVRQAQVDVAASLDNVMILETSDLTFIDDVHYDVASRETIAERFIDEVDVEASNVDFSAVNGPVSDDDNEIVMDNTDNVVDAGLGNDTINTIGGDDHITAGAGEDIINAGSGNDTIFAGSDNDKITAGNGDDLIQAQFGEDTIIAGNGNDTVFGGAGHDLVAGGAGNDLISGAAGHDTIDGGAGNDGIFGGQDKDLLLGNEGNDTIVGGHGDDQISGGAGNDFIIGGIGSDVMHGNTGSDIFIFKNIPESGASDVIKDFDHTEDFIMMLDYDGMNFDALDFTQVGNATVITSDLMGNNEIHLQNFDVADADQIEFYFG